MVIFINDRPFRLTDAQRADLLREKNDYDVVVDSRLETPAASHLHGHVLVLNASSATAEKLLALLHEQPLAELQTLTVQVADRKTTSRRLMSHFKVVKAAGGVVVKGQQVLLMYRLRRWDLPKGKLDVGEKSRVAALREVAEETGVLADLGGKVCTTWHTYTQNGSRILKKTKWYRMNCLYDGALRPQTDEGIEQLVWMNKREIQNALVDSYSSIRYVFDQFWKEEKQAV